MVYKRERKGFREGRKGERKAKPLDLLGLLFQNNQANPNISPPQHLPLQPPSP